MNPIRILLVDDQTLLRDALEVILNLEDDFEVVGVASHAQEAYDLVKTLQPDLVLMDIKMPVMNGIEGTKKIKADFPSTLILILSTFAEEEDIVECLAHGATGYLLKDMHGDRLLNAIRDAANGQFILQGPIAAKLASRLFQMNQYASPIPNLHNVQVELTDREKEIASLIVKGYTNREIAKALFISEGTVRNYISTLYSKMGTSDRSKLLLFLKELGIKGE
ncbi:response regulator transcription factor [Bacillus carboniphilus]|uniref:Response regulator transcription factor n=1 Tax=Bacillus carboniphilus TaxID=86663 RepID=A0ABN0W585_9BACI